MTTGGSHDPETIRRIHAVLRRRAARLVAKREDAEDVVQETWLAALRHRHAIRDSEGWLRRVVRYQALRRRRNEILRREREARVARGPHSLDEERELEPVERRVSEALAALREPYGTVMRMRFEEELSPEEIARRLDRPVATVKSQINRAMKRMRSRLPEPARERGRSRLTALFAPVLRLAHRVVGVGAEPMTWTVLCTALATAVIVLTPDPRTHAPAGAPLASVPGAGEPSGSIRHVPGDAAAARRPIGSEGDRRPARADAESLPHDGLVLDMSGAPAGGARVWAAPRGAIGAAVHVATTDDAGRFQVLELPPETYLTAEGDAWLPRGWAVVEERASDAAPTGVLTLRVLAARNRIRGHVRDEEGRLLPGALVAKHQEPGAPWIEPPFGWRIPGSMPGARTGVDGSFELGAHHHFAHRLMVTAAGYAPALHGVRAGEGSVDVEIVLTRGETLEGSVELPLGAPAIGASVEFVPVAPFPALTTRTGPDGRFVLPHVAPGAGTLIVRGAERAEGLAHRSLLEVPASASLDVVLSERWSIRGEARDARGRRLIGWTVVARRECDRPELLERLDPWRGAEVRGVTDAEGRFALGGVEEDLHRLYLLPPGEHTVARATALVERPAGAHVALVVNDDLARLEGRVPPDAMRAVGRRLILRAPELLHDRVVPVDAESGRFAVSELLPGEYTLFLFDPMGPPMRLGEWLVASGELVDVGPLALPREDTLVLRVRGPSGPVDPQSVFLRSLEGYGVVQRLSEMVRSAPGELTTRAVPSGTYELLVKAPECADHVSEVVVESPGRCIDVDLVPGGFVVVSLRAPREFEAVRPIDLRFESLSGSVERRTSLVPAAALDKLTLNLPFGWHRVHATAADGSSRTVEFLVSGEQSSVEVDMRGDRIPAVPRRATRPSR